MKRTRTFAFRPQSVPEARHFVGRLLTRTNPEDAEAIELMVSELATNCIRHAAAGFTLGIDVTDREVRVEVSDTGTGTPAVRSPKPLEPSGRGLKIVGIFADAWGVTETPGGRGKTVSFTRELQLHASR